MNDLSVVGTVDVKVQYEQQTRELPLTVDTGGGPFLLSRDWLHLTMNWREIKLMSKHAQGTLRLPIG